MSLRRAILLLLFFGLATSLSAQRKAPTRDTALVRIVAPAAPQPLSVLVLPKTPAEFLAERKSREIENPPMNAATLWALWIAGIAGVIALVQAGFFLWQLRKMSSQTRSMHDAFVATHRPRLIVRGVHLVTEMTQIDDGSISGRNERAFYGTFNVHFTVVNAGATTATLKKLYVSSPLSPTLIYLGLMVEPNESNQVIGKVSALVGRENMELQSGAELHFVGNSPHFKWSLIPQQITVGFFVGSIGYTSSTGTNYQTGFVRQIHEDASVTRVENPDFEFAD